MLQFATWKINDDEEYKLKLKTSAVCEVEKELGTSLLNAINSDGMPSLNVMLTIAHAAMKDWNANIKKKDIFDIFDRYIEAGGSQLEFFSIVIMDIYKVSGFFTEAQAEEMDKAQEKMVEM